MKRLADIHRKTGETDVKLKLNIDGQGKGCIDTPAHFLNHMLTLLCKHALFDLKVKATGDVEVDYHHLVEDVGIVLGEAMLKAIGDKKGICRYASFYVPMDEALGFCTIDISGRPYLYFKADFKRDKVGDFDVELAEEFFRAFVNNARLTMHIENLRGENTHHMIEALFKACGRCLREAVAFDPREKGIPSTKGIL